MTEKEIENSSYISLAQAAAIHTEYSQEYLSLRARQGKFKAVKIGRNWLTKKEWIDEYVSQVNGGNGNGDSVGISDTGQKEDFAYLSLAEVENYSGYSQEYLGLRARQGKLRAVKIGRNWLTKKEWIDEYKIRVNGNEQQSPTVKKLPWSEKAFHSVEAVFRNFIFVLKTKKIVFIVGVLLIFCSTGLVLGYPYVEKFTQRFSEYSKVGFNNVISKSAEFIQPFKNFISENSRNTRNNLSLEKTFQSFSGHVVETTMAFENVEPLIEGALKDNAHILFSEVKNFVEQMAAGWGDVKLSFSNVRSELKSVSRDYLLSADSNWRYNSQAVFFRVNQWGDILAGQIESFSRNLMDNTKEGAKFFITQTSFKAESAANVVAREMSYLTASALDNFQQSTQSIWEKIKFSADTIDNKIAQGAQGTAGKLKFFAYIYKEVSDRIVKDYEFVVSPWRQPICAEVNNFVQDFSVTPQPQNDTTESTVRQPTQEIIPEIAGDSTTTETTSTTIIEKSK